LSADAPAVAEARDLLAELVDIPSPSGSEGKIVDRIEDLARGWSIPALRVRSELGRDSLVLGCATKPALAFVAHVDTIAAPWPAKARVEGDVVHGLGAADDKGGVVACLLAARDLVAAGEDLDRLEVAFAFPVDEERGGSGSRTVALELAPRRAIALEATGLRVGTVETGDIDVWVHVQGRMAHGALTEIGENAIHGAVELIGALGRLGLDQHSHPLLGSSQAEVGAIRGGTEFNTVPDRCSFQLQIRVVPGQDGDATLAALEELAAEHSATVEVTEMTRPFEADSESPMVASLEARTAEVAGSERERIGVPAWTDAHNMVDFAGAEAVVYGPGDFSVAHTVDECIDVNEVVECAEIFKRLARDAAGW
jgi:acetylornithine deacetylase/succinyl-diaminopimelate desuccinylase-like protein